MKKKDDSYKKVIEKGELVIGLDAYYPPMGFYDQDGDIVGFDIEKLDVGFRKNDLALRDTINAVLTSMKKDGKFVDITVKWFGK